MKKMITAVVLAALALAAVWVGLYVYSVDNLPEALGEKNVTWQTADGGFFHVDEEGGIQGELPLAKGGMQPFWLGYREQYGEGFSDEELQKLLFTAGLRLRGTNIVFEIEEDRGGLNSNRYIFSRAGA